MTETTEQQRPTSARSVRGIPFFADLTPEESETVDNLFVKRSYAKNQIVLLEEETCTCMYLIYYGKVRVVKQNEDGKEQIITIHKKNDFFGEMSLLDNKTAPATVIAHEDSVIGFLSKADFDTYLLSNHDIQRKIINLLCSRLRDAWEMIRILSFNEENARDRVVSMLQRLGEVYGIEDTAGIIIDVKLTHQQMANFASVTRETMTRVLRALAKTEEITILDDRSIILSRRIFGENESRKAITETDTAAY